MLEVPKGGGALRSLGEKFQPNPFSGTGDMTVPVAVSPGRGGFGPQLSVQYSSGSGNGPCGLGWNLGVPSITRKTDKGIPLYEDGRDSDVFILSGAEDLVPVVSGGAGATESDKIPIDKGTHIAYRYRPRIEGLFARIERWVDKTTGDAHWRATTRDNVTSIYGLSHDARVLHPDDDLAGLNAPRTFRWLLEETFDDRGNYIVYEYKQEDLTDVDQGATYEADRLAANPTQAERYIKRIKYGNVTPGVKDDWVFEVVFDYGEHGTWNSPASLTISPSEDTPWPSRLDPFSTHRSGFDIRTRRLCRRVLMFHTFAELGSPVEPVLVSSTDFLYDEGPVVTYLTGVTQRGYLRDESSGDYIPSELPTLHLAYEPLEIDDTISEVDQTSLENLARGIDDTLFRLVDVDGEGLPGVLTEQAGDLYYKRPLGDGRFGPLVALPKQASAATLAGGARLMDVEGDGVPDLVVFTRPSPGFYARAREGGWESFRAFRSVPNVDWQDPNLQLLDVSGDGFPDVVLARDDHFLWYRSKGRDGFDHPLRVRKPHDERDGATVLFADATQSVQLADMTGDGLTDIVRVRNGDVCYWPNLGHGRFGRRIVLANAPHFDHPHQFNPNRVRMADIDGTGTADIVYLGRGFTKLYFNQAGNAFADEVVLAIFPNVDRLANVQVVDFKGTGTACLVWSHPSGDGRAGSLRFVDLMGGKKPHLLIASNNNMGAETRLAYVASTKFYLQDRDAGRPWLTRLPFPVHVLERVEAYDHIAKTKLVNHFRYHHGFYDAAEREFRGFAMVEQWDTESFEEFGGSGLFTFDDLETVEENLHQPPVYTKTWFHTGAFVGGPRLSALLEDEYYAGGNEARLPDTVLPSGLRAVEAVQAARALKGRVLRQEVYALDGSPAEPEPYTVAETNFTVVVVQAKDELRHGVYFVHDRETLTYHYERDPTTPRIAHAAVLEVDTYGNPTKTVSIGYPSTGSPPLPYAEQGGDAVIVHAESAFANHDEATHYRIGVPYEAKTYEIHGLDDDTVPLPFDTLVTAIDEATEIAYDATPSGMAVQKRVLSHGRSYFYSDDLSGVLALGQAGQRALPHHSRQAAMTTSQVTTLFPAEVDDTLLETEGGYVEDQNLWWTVSGRQVFDAAHFYLPTSSLDPFGNVYTLAYDAYDLLLEGTQDPLGNTVSVQNDYRVLAPWEVTDPNGNRMAVAFDGLGVPVKTAVMGKTTESLGDTLSDPTTTLDYDLFAWQSEGKPNFVHTAAREEHQNGSTPWQESYTYFDGSGRVAMVKVQAEPGLAPERDENGELVLEGSPPMPVLVDTSPDVRWVGTGRTVYDNKGNPVKQYEPYFSSTSDFENEAELVEQGVTPVLHYDPLGRLIRTDFPDGTFATVEFNAWTHVTFDQNDNVLESDWYAERIAYGGADEGLLAEKRAAQITEAHAGTPTTVHLDKLGRVFVTVQHAGFTDDSPPLPILHETHLQLDVQGNVLSVTDARDNTAETNVYGLLGQVLVTDSEDAGERQLVADVVGNPLRAYNERGFRSRFEYDALLRATHHFVQPPSETEMLVTLTLYGEELASPANDNHRGRVYRLYDTAGELTNDAFDFKGNLLQQTRRLVVGYEHTQDWSALDEVSPWGVDEVATAADADLETESFTISTTYDALNRPVTQTTPDDSELELTYNEASLLEAVDVRIRGAGSATTFVSDIDYNARGQRELIVYGNDTHTTYAYDPQTFRLTRLHTVRDGSPPESLQDLKYTYDPVGNITQIRDDAQEEVYFDNAVVEPDQEFEYNPLYRLISATGREHTSLSQTTESDLTPGPQPHPNNPAALRTYTQQYEYDPVGNLLRMIHTATGGNWTRGYDYSAVGNRLTRSSLPGDTVSDPETYSATYTYDAHGNMTSMPHLAAIDWDFADRMQHCDLGGGGDVWFVYDATGARVRKVQVNSSGSTVKERIYLGPFELYREHAGSPLQVDLERESLHVSDDTGRICIVETKTIENGSTVGSPVSKQRFQYGNHLGTAALEVDEAALIISYEEFHPFGTTAYAANDSGIEVSAKRYRYIGKERDEETGLYQCGARYLAAWLGRWTAADPIGLGDGVNRYAYARGNPVRLVDPDGTKSMTEAQAREAIEMSRVATAYGQLAMDQARAEEAQQLLRSSHTPNAADPLAQFSARDVAGVDLQSQAEELFPAATDKYEGAYAKAIVNVAVQAPFNASLLIMSAADPEGAEKAEAIRQEIRPFALGGGDDPVAAAEIIADLGFGAVTGGGSLADDLVEAGIRTAGKVAPKSVDNVSGAAAKEGGDSTALVPFDPEFATKQLLGVSKTPGGKQINFHAADRMVNPPGGRVPMSVNEVEHFVDTADSIKKIKITDEGTSVTLLNSRYPKAQIAVDGDRIITVVNPRRRK